MADDEEADQHLDEPSPFAEWLRSEMEKQNISIQELANKTGLTSVGIWSIVKGHTKSPRDETRARLSAALNSQIPREVETEMVSQSSVSGYTWTDFSPYDLQRFLNKLVSMYFTILQTPGICRQIQFECSWARSGPSDSILVQAAARYSRIVFGGSR